MLLLIIVLHVNKRVYGYINGVINVSIKCYKLVYGYINVLINVSI
jgi:hypothetical protein